MDHLKMHSLNKIDENIAKIAQLFPNCVTEAKGENGEITKKIDFDMLKQELSSTLVEGREERYQFTWPDKKQAILTANAPINKTLRPCREESVNFDETENLYIEGDNLEVLKLLQETYLGKIKMIYIDPPYNTGNDFVYNDDFSGSRDEWLGNSGNFDENGNQVVDNYTKNTESNGRFHTDWLNMIYPRLKLAKDLLSDDGILVISISYQEIINLSKICTELFNKQVSLITVQTSGGKPSGGFNYLHEYLVFVVPKDFYPNPLDFCGGNERTPFEGLTLSTFDKIQRPNQVYPIFIDTKTNLLIGTGKSLQERIDDGSYKGSKADFSYVEDNLPNGIKAVWPITSKGKDCVWRQISDRLKTDWEKGYIKISKSKDDNYSIQYLPSGIIEKIEKGELQVLGKEEFAPTLKLGKNQTVGGQIPTIWLEKDFYTVKGTNLLVELFPELTKAFDYPKSLKLIYNIVKSATDEDSIILDFFSGSATTAHAVMQLNAEDGGNRKFIMVQLPELCDEKSEAFKAGYKNICEIGKERIRRAGQQILKQVQNDKEKDGLFSEVSTGSASALDIGFRVLKCDTSNMEDVYYSPDHFDKQDLFKNNIKNDRTAEDLLFQVMLDLGIMLSSKIETKKIDGKTVYYVEGNYLVACFDEDVTEETITKIAKETPYYFVMKDSSMANDSVATNFEQIFTTYSPETIRKVL